MIDPNQIRKLYDRYPEMVTKGDADGIVALYAAGRILRTLGFPRNSHPDSFSSRTDSQRSSSKAIAARPRAMLVRRSDLSPNAIDAIE